MIFDIFAGYQRLEGPENFSTSIVKEGLERAVLADRLGYNCIWVPEHHLINFMQVPCGVALCAQIGMRVQCRVGQMVNLLNYRHPLVVVGEVATLDQILDGRLELGIGRGAYQYEFERLGISFSDSQERFMESLEILERSWHNPESGIEHSGAFYRFDTSYVWPRPVQTPHPPIWYAAMSPRSIALGAERGYHVTTWPFLKPMGAVAQACEAFHDARADQPHDGDKQEIGILRAAYASNDERDLMDAGVALIRNHRINQRLHYFTQNADPRGYVAPDPWDDEPTPSEARDNTICGTPKECIDKVAEYESLGVDRLLLQFDFGAPHEQAMEAMTCFAEEVMAPYRQRATHPGP